MNIPAPAVWRDTLAETVRKDLLGPAGGEEEELHQEEDHVYSRYLVGVLAPRQACEQQPIPAGELAELAAGGEDDVEGGKTDASAPMPSFFPSSMGLSFSVDASTTELLVAANWGRYERVKSEGQVKVDGSAALVWKRVPMQGVPWRLRLTEGAFKDYAPCNEQPDVVIEGRARRSPAGWMVTLFLVNHQPEQDRRKDEAWLFQPKLSITSADGRAASAGQAQWRHLGPFVTRRAAGPRVAVPLSPRVRRRTWRRRACGKC